MVDASQQRNYDSNKNGKLKGRKRFNADLADLQEAAKMGLNFDSLVVKSEFLEQLIPYKKAWVTPSLGVRAGDDEGSVEVIIEKDSSERVVTVNFLISGICGISPVLSPTHSSFRHL